MAACPALTMRCLLPILAAACWAGEAEAVQVRLAAAATLETHWDASVFGQVMAEPAAAALRSRWATWLAGWRGVQDAHAIQLELAGVDGKGQPRWAMQADLGTQAPLAARRLAATYRFPRPAVVPAADEAWLLDGLVLARFGGIVSFGRPIDLLPLAPTRPSTDIAVDVGFPALSRAVRAALGPEPHPVDGLLALIAGRWRSLAVRAELTPEGSSWRGTLHGASTGLRAADRSLLARLPAAATAVLVIGLDGPRLWADGGEALLSAIAGLTHGPGPAGQAAARAALAQILPGQAGLQPVVEGCDGSIALLLTPGVPYPGFSLVLPRQAAVDGLMAGLCGRFGAYPPADGGHVFVAVPDLPVPLFMARGRSHWLATTDAQLAATWGLEGAGGFADTAMGIELQRRAPAEACLLLACDSGATLRALIGQINQALAPNRDLNQPEKQALLTAAARLSTLLTPAYQWGVAAADRIDVSGGGGDLTWIALPALAAAWALPEWIENGSAASEKAAMTTLKTALFPAQVQFQAAAHVDQDGDGAGEYGLLSELTGRRPAGKAAEGGIQLVQGALTTGEISNGYRFTIYLPDGMGGAIGEPDGLQARPSIVGPGRAADADEQEARYVIYAWPVDAEAGQRIFAVDQSGLVRERLWDGQAPAWNSLYDGGSWADEPAWPVVKRGARRR